MAGAEVASGGFVVIALPCDFSVAVEVEDGPVGPGAVDLETVEPRQEFGLMTRLRCLSGQHCNRRDAFAVFRFIEDFTVFPYGGNVIVNTSIKNTIFIDVQSRNVYVNMGIQHLAVLPNVCSVVVA